MKKFSFLTAILFTCIFTIFWQGCNDKNDDPPESDWTDEDQQSFESSMSLQEEAGLLVTSYLQTMDTAEAITALAQWFDSDPDVEWAQPGAQGVMVLYKNGLRGGVLVDGLRGNDNPGPPCGFKSANMSYGKDLKSIPNNKKMIYLGVTYFEFINFEQMMTVNYQQDYSKVFQEYTELWEEDCTLDAFANLNGYGYIHLSSHGIPWPYPDSYEKVYLLTGETPTESVCEKYSELLKSDDIIGIYSENLKRNVFCISPEFIMKYNDFSQDTILCYGSFCFSFLGTWPSLVNKFANGAYFGYDWAVMVPKDVDYVNSLFDHLSNTQAATPWTTEQWFTGTPELPKQYFAEHWGKLVKLQYAGNTDLSFWVHDKVEAVITSTEPDGAPVSVPGLSNTEYTFVCEIENADPQFLKFTWNFNDGTGLQVISQDNSINHSWTNPGTFQVTVTVHDLTTDELLAQASVSANIGTPPVSYISNYNTSKPTYSLNFNLESNCILTSSTIGFRVIYDSLIYLAWPPAPDFTYKHSVFLKEKPLNGSETRTFQLSVTLGTLTSTLPGTWSLKKVVSYANDKDGEHFQEFDGLSPMNFTLTSDQTHYVSIILTAQVWDGSSIPFELYPIELVIYKDE